MISAIANLLPAVSNGREMAQVLGMAVDGAIVRAQFDTSPEQALSGLERIVSEVTRPTAARRVYETCVVTPAMTEGNAVTGKTG